MDGCPGIVKIIFYFYFYFLKFIFNINTSKPYKLIRKLIYNKKIQILLKIFFKIQK